MIKFFKIYFSKVRQIKELQKDLAHYRRFEREQRQDNDLLRKYYNDVINAQVNAQASEIIQLKDLIEAKNLIIEKLKSEQK